MQYQKLERLPPIIAHRGASAYAPENTRAAIYKAKALGVQWVEFDVRLAACGELCVIHSNRLKYTSSGKGRVSKTPYTEIAKLDAGSWFSPEYAGEIVPSLSNVMAYLLDCQLCANIEVKTVRNARVNTAIKLVEQLQSSWPDELFPPLISSFSLTCLRHIRKLDSQLLLSLLLKRWSSNWQKTADELACVSVHVNYRALTEQRIAMIKDTGRFALAYAVNDPEKAKQLFAWGIDAIFTGYPDKLAEVIGR